jgi:phosphatidylinositol 4-kinase
MLLCCSWAARSARVQASSPFGSRPGWGLAGVIVKSGDDCRQELLALQLIRELGEIWAGETCGCCFDFCTSM